LDIPEKFTAAINGHIHRAQILIRDISGRYRIPPIIHPGSTERTSFAEKDEPKGYMILELALDGSKSHIYGIHFEELPTRPMVRIELGPIEVRPGELSHQIRNILLHQNPDSIIQIRLSQVFPKKILHEISNPNLRNLAPETMNVSVSLVSRNERS